MPLMGFTEITPSRPSFRHLFFAVGVLIAFLCLAGFWSQPTFDYKLPWKGKDEAASPSGDGRGGEASRSSLNGHAVPILQVPEPRLNTTWHHQIALESLEENNDLEEVQTPYGLLNRKRVALIMENRPLPYLIPLLIHFIATVPREWSFRFMGSEASVAMLGANPIIQSYVRDKKLFLDLIPYDHVRDFVNYNQVNRFLASAYLYREWLWPSDWLFLFQDDSMICSNSVLTLNDFVDQDWSFMGSKTGDNDLSTGGGFSLRKIPHLLRLLEQYSFKQWRQDGRVASEDYFFSMALREYDWARIPEDDDVIRFGLVRHFPDNMVDMPLGFHPFSSDGMFRGARAQENQDKAYAYCPELAIISTGRWNCKCSPDGRPRGGLGD